jgi:hypothetical protein
MRQKFDYAKRRICAHGMNALRWLFLQPLKTIGVM